MNASHRPHAKTTPVPLTTARLLSHAAFAFAALAQEPAARPVEVARPRREAITRFVTLPGTVRANQQVALQARVSGFVASISVDRGDRVKAGQVVAVLDTPELQADKARLSAELAVASRDLARLRKARERDPALVTDEAWDGAQGRVDVAMARLGGVEVLLGHARITAPFDGVVVDRHVDTGAYLAAATSGNASRVVSLSETKSLRAHVPVPEPEARLVHVGQPVHVLVEGGPPAGFAAKVSRHAGALDEDTRCLAVEADLPMPPALLMPGMSASVRIGLEQRTNALVIPSEAVLVERSGASVFTVEDGRSRRRAVKLGFVDGAASEVTEGLPHDAVVIVPARGAPADGKAVSTGGTR